MSAEAWMLMGAAVFGSIFLLGVLVIRWRQ